MSEQDKWFKLGKMLDQWAGEEFPENYNLWPTLKTKLPETGARHHPGSIFHLKRLVLTGLLLTIVLTLIITASLVFLSPDSSTAMPDVTGIMAGVPSLDIAPPTITPAPPSTPTSTTPASSSSAGNRNGLPAKLAWSPDSNTLATVGAGNEDIVRLWGSDGKLVKVLTGSGIAAHELVWAPDGKYLAVSYNGASNTTPEVKLWSGDSVATTINAATSPMWSPDGTKLVTVSAKRNTVQVWDVTGKELLTFAGNYDVPPDSPHWSPDGSLIAASFQPESTVIWNASNGNIVTTLTGISGELDWSGDSQVLAVGSATKGKLELVSRDGKPLKSINENIITLRWSPDHKILAAVSTEGNLQFWQAEGTLLATAPGMDALVYLDWSPDSKMLVTGVGSSPPVRFWNAVGQPLSKGGVHSEGGTQVAWSPNGKLVASQGYSRETPPQVTLWDNNGNLLSTLKDTTTRPVITPDPNATAFTCNYAGATVIPTVTAAGNPLPTPTSVPGKLQWPVRGTITTYFGEKQGNDSEYGALALHSEAGTPVVAAETGTVVEARYRDNLGNVITITHANGLTTLYAHLSTIKVKAGETVKQGQIIGELGCTGSVSGPILRFEVRQGGIDGLPVNPLNFLS